MLILPTTITLENASFYKSKPIDLRIGAEIFWQPISIGKLSNDQPVIQKTNLEWILSSSVYIKNTYIKESVHCNISLNDNFLNETLAKFW